MSNSQRDQATFTALGLLLLISGGLVALSALVVPSLIVLPGLVFLLLFVGTLHYVTWGWWLSRLKPPDDDDE